ncbi:hypothetical protein [Oceaniglobus roseus]|uniref:hypothetical protein n=1 Tax=Oceaniglobus roseus TaxID=1737570 RepID=UPI000C7F6852|nr:hypothetical protein [Kandeliimicrobium roseum]
MTPRSYVLPLVLSILAGAGSAQQGDDLFAFIPPGGRTLLERGLAAGDAELAAAIATARPAVEWSAFFAESADAALSGLDDWERQTLADYLAYTGAIAPGAELPTDGRDMMLARCQSCHIITVTVTQARTRDAWLATLGRTSHVEIPLGAAEREQLADYLAVNAGLPIDVIPPELRAGGASY